MILRRLHIIFVLIAILAISPTTIFASTNTIKENLVIRNVLVEDDALYVIHYEIEYDAYPPGLATPETMAEYHKGQVKITLDGVTSEASSGLGGAIYPDIQPTEGFGEGLWGIYFPVDPLKTTAALAASVSSQESCNAKIIGGSLSALPTYCSSVFSQEYDATIKSELDLFQAKMISYAEHLENEWDTTSAPVDLIINIAGFQKLTSTGDAYFSGAVPQIRNVVPTLFTSGLTSPSIILDETREEGYETARKNYFQGTELDITDGSGSALDLIGDVVGLDDNPQLVGTAIVLLAGMAIAFFVVQATQNTTVGIFCIILVLQVGAFIGLVSFAVVAVLALIGALALGYIFFYKSSTS